MLKIAYSTRNGLPNHRGCIYLRDEVCTLSGVGVDPSKPACPNFTPKIKTTRPPAARAYPEARQTYQPYVIRTIATCPPQDYHPRFAFEDDSLALNTPMQGRASFVIASPRAGGRGGIGEFGARGRGRMGGVSAGPRDSCVCPNCRYTTSHIVGTPRYQQTCPRCGSKKTRGS